MVTNVPMSKGRFCLCGIFYESIQRSRTLPKASRMRPSHQLPNYLRAYRKRSGLSQEELAFAADLSGKSELCQLERFYREPSYRTAASCARALGVSTDQLFAGTNASAVEKALPRQAATISGVHGSFRVCFEL